MKEYLSPSQVPLPLCTPICNCSSQHEHCLEAGTSTNTSLPYVIAQVQFVTTWHLLIMQLQERAKAAAVEGGCITAAARWHAAAAAAWVQPTQNTCSDTDDDLEPRGTVTRVCYS